MDFTNLINNRYSVRSYKNDKVSENFINQILLAAKSSPTAHNFQPQEIIVVNSLNGINLLNKCSECHYNAPLAFIIGYNKKKAWVREYDGKCSGDVDASIVTTHMMLMAQSLGLGTTWIMYFIPEAIKVEFGLSSDIEPVSILYVGYADDKPSKNHLTRREIKEYVSFK